MPHPTCRPPCRQNSQYLNMVTIHWYRAQAQSNISPWFMLEEGPIEKDMGQLRELVKVGRLLHGWPAQEGGGGGRRGESAAVWLARPGGRAGVSRLLPHAG